MKEYQEALSARIAQEKAAIELIKITSDLSYEKSIELVLFRNRLIDKSSSEVLNLHDYAKKIVEKPIEIVETLAIAKTISESNLPPSKIDIGKLTHEWIKEKQSEINITSFISSKLSFLSKESKNITPKDIILFGFGRIGRLVARELMAQEGRGDQLRLRIIVLRNNDRLNMIKRASLLRTDSVHGKFKGTVIADTENKSLIINGQSIKVIEASNPEEIDYKSFGIDNALLMTTREYTEIKVL